MNPALGPSGWPQLYRVRLSKEWLRDLELQAHLLRHFSEKTWQSESSGIKYEQRPGTILNSPNHPEAWGLGGGEGSGITGELALKDTKKAEMLDLQLPL